MRWKARRIGGREEEESALSVREGDDGRRGRGRRARAAGDCAINQLKVATK